MIFSESIVNDITSACNSALVAPDHKALLKKLKQIYPSLTFSHVLTRPGWYRTGGLFDSNDVRISHNLRDWLETEKEGDLTAVFDEYVDAGLVVTNLIGKTHYFVVQIGEASCDFVQMEVEELQEVKDHILFGEETLPDDIEDIVDPVGVEKIAAQAIDEPHYVFRRITCIADYMRDFLQALTERGKKTPVIQRFIQDWERGSANEYGPFCQHWIFSLQDYTDAYGEIVKQIKPISTFMGELPDMMLDERHRGVVLANLINKFDHVVGYPMAWYFFMLSHSEIPHALAEAIHKDLVGAYDYLPAKDLKVVQDWSARPYGV